MADPAAMTHPGFALTPIAKKKLNRLQFSAVLAAVWSFTFASEHPAIAQPTGVTGYEAVELEPLPTGDWTNVTALDDLGRVLGRSTTSAEARIVVWDNGKPIVLPIPPDVEPVREINISPTTGIIIGAPLGRDPRQALIWTKRSVGYLPLMTGLESNSAFAVNDSGWFVGTAYTFNFGRPALWIRGRDPIDLGDLGGGQAGAIDVNDHGWILGCSLRPGGGDECCPVIWEPNGEIVDLFKNVTGEARNYLSAQSLNNVGEVVGGNWYLRNGNLIATGNMSGGCGCAWDAINDSGLFVGYCNVDPSCLPKYKRAFITEALPDWEMRRHNVNDYLLRQPDITLLDAYDINNAGQIAAFGELPGGEERGFLVTPYQFELSEPVPGVAGERNMITVTNLEPNQRVILVFGTKEGAQPIGNGCLGGLVLIRDVSTHKSLEAFADNSGVATFNVFVPKSTAGKTVRYQAIAPDECEISHTVEFSFQ